MDGVKKATKGKKPKAPTIQVDQNSPAMMRGAIHQIIRSAVNLWVWDTVLRTKEMPDASQFWVYARDLELSGPLQMNGKRVVVRLEVEEI